jgi:predicted membrane protein
MEDGRMDRELSFLYSFYVPNTYCFIWSINRFAL